MSKGNDVNKTGGSPECILCHYWYVLNMNFRFQLKVCNGFHNLMQKTIVSIEHLIASDEANNYRIHFWYMSEDKALDLLRNTVLTEKGEYYKN